MKISLLALFIFVLTSFTNANFDKVFDPIIISISSIKEDADKYRLLLNVRNQTDSTFVRNAILTVYNQKKAIWIDSLKTISAGQSVARTYTNSNSLINNSYLVIDYYWKSEKHSRVLPINIEKSEGRSELLNYLPVLSSLIGIVVGAWLLHFFTVRREERKNRLEWNKMLFDKYEKNYRTFLRKWGNSYSLVILEQEFNTLQDNSLISNKIRKGYAEVQAVLLRPNSTQKEKADACDKFINVVEKFFDSPGVI